jgi:hypothetical protein
LINLKYGDQIITRSIGSVRTLSRRGTWPGQEVQVLDGVVRQLGLAGLLHTQCIIYELTPPDILLSSSTKHREDINHLGHLLHHRPEHPQQQERTKIRNIIRNLNQVEESKKKEKSDKSKKKEIDDDLNHKKKEKEPRKMFQKIQKRKFIHIQVKYHTCKNQGLELGRDARNHHTETQVLGFRNRLPLQYH